MLLSVGLSVQFKSTFGLELVYVEEQACILEGIMDAPLYIQVLEETLLLFLWEVYPDTHRFMADNDPKYTSNAAKKFLLENHVNWWQTPAESPDCNLTK